MTPYVKEREAFGEPIAHRQSVAFMVADIAIELQAMRLLTYKAAARAAAGKDFSPRGRAGPQAVRRQGHADRPRRRPAARRPRLRQGAPGGAVVPRPAGRRRHGRKRAGLMINLDDPKKFRPLVDQAHQVAMNMLRPISRKYDRAEHEYPKELDMLAAMIDGLAESGGERGRRRRRRHAATSRRTTTAGVQERHQPRLGACPSPRCAGATSGCCSRCPARASATPPSPRWPTTSSTSGSTGVWAAMAITEPGTGSDSANITTTAGPRRRRLRPQRREDLRHLRRPRRRRRRLGDARQGPRPRGDQVVRGAEGHARHEGRAARAQARHPGLRHRDDPLRGLPGAGGEPARLARGRRQAGLRRRDGDLRQHPAAGRRDGRRLRPRRRST